MRVVIIGAGGHAQVVADALLRIKAQDGSVEPIGYLDDDPPLEGAHLLGLPVLGPVDRLRAIAHDAVIVGIGDNNARRRHFETLHRRGERFAVACHPAAVLAPSVEVGGGTVICAGVIVNTGAVIGANVILNTGATIDHHNQIADHAHIAPGVHLGGEVSVGEGALIGLGATVLPRRRVGMSSVAGASACVTRSVADSTDGCRRARQAGDARSPAACGYGRPV